MNAHADSATATDGSRPDDREARRAPAYGPVAAVLGFALCYVVVDHVTPTVREVLPAVLGVSPSLVGLGLAGFLWFVLGVTVLDQVRRQLAALGVGSHEAVRPGLWERVVPGETRTLVDLAVLVAGSALAALTFERALDAVVSLVRALVPVDVGALDVGALVLLVVFAVSFGAATHALDRLVVDALRRVLGD